MSAPPASQPLAFQGADLGPDLGSAADRRAFLKAVSHELRTPLNAIIGFSELMTHEIHGPMPEGYRDYAGIISDNGRHLLQLVDDFFETAMRSAGPEAAEPASTRASEDVADAA